MDLSYFDIGYEAGQMAVKILKGESTPAELPVQYPQNIKFVLNKALLLGIELKMSGIRICRIDRRLI